MRVCQLLVPIAGATNIAFAKFATLLATLFAALAALATLFAELTTLFTTFVSGLADTHADAGDFDGDLCRGRYRRKACQSRDRGCKNE
jgi:hypothetical protein